MIDLPPQMPPMPDRPVAEAISECGVRTDRFTVTYDEDLQGNMIVFAKDSGADLENLQCIWEATWSDFVEFADAEMQEAYTAIGQRYFEANFKDKILDSARTNLAKHGLLESLPKMERFRSREEFAEALEIHCGFAAQSILRVEGESFTVWPQTDATPLQDTDYEKFSCLLSALTLASADNGDMKIGFVGNERFAD